jgi:hypothetical protein
MLLMSELYSIFLGSLYIFPGNKFLCKFVGGLRHAFLISWIFIDGQRPIEIDGYIYQAEE